MTKSNKRQVVKMTAADYSGMTAQFVSDRRAQSAASFSANIAAFNASLASKKIAPVVGRKRSGPASLLLRSPGPGIGNYRNATVDELGNWSGSKTGILIDSLLAVRDTDCEYVPDTVLALRLSGSGAVVSSSYLRSWITSDLCAKGFGIQSRHNPETKGVDYMIVRPGEIATNEPVAVPVAQSA